MAVTGEKEIRAGLRKALRQYPDAVAAAIMKMGFAIAAVGMEQTPVEAGILRRSWYVAPPTDPKNPVVEIGVGTSYALFVHENTKAHFRAGKKARFIRDPVNQRRSGYVRQIKEWAADFVRRGIGIRALPRTMPPEPSEESKGV